MTVGVRPAVSPDDYVAFAGLVVEYVDWCRGRYRDLGGFVESVFGHQSLATELQGLSTKYAPPSGRAFLAFSGGRVSGCGAYRHLPDGSCEMKRLFVPDRSQGHGVGRRLCDALVASARDDGYRLMRLDTGDRFTAAIALYASLGFVACAPHHDYPPELMRNLVFMELRLPARTTG